MSVALQTPFSGYSSPPVAGPARTAVPVFLALLISATVFVPAEVHFFIFELRLGPARLLLLLAAIPILVAFLMSTGRPGYVFVWSDLLVVVLVAWLFIAVLVTEGLQRALVAGGSSALEFVVPYLGARALLRADGAERALVRFFVLCVIVTIGIALIDTATSGYTVRNVFAQALGTPLWNTRADEFRIGLHRAMGVSDHPIHLGMLSLIAGVLALSLPRALAVPAVLATLVGVFISLSSAPWQGVIIATGLLLFYRYGPRIPGRWGIMLSLFLTTLAAFIIVHPNPWGYIVSNFTFDPGSGYYRMMLWTFAGDLVLRNPIWGVGTGVEWERPEFLVQTTVDAHFLRMAMMYGIPGSTLIFLILVGGCFIAVDRATGVNLSERDKHLGTLLSICLFLLVYLGMTVTYWNQLWVLSGLLAGLRANLGAKSRDWTVSRIG